MDVSFVWLDGALVPRAEAGIPVDDWGFLYGDTLFETLRVARGEPLAWRPHMQRLVRSARRLRYRLDTTPEAILDALRRTLAANQLSDAVARITLTRGGNQRNLRLRDCAGPRLLIAVRPFSAAHEAQLRRGIRLRTVRVPDREGWLRYRTKSGNYLDFLLALDAAFGSGADEALLVDRQNRVLEGARSNVFAVIGGRLATPPVRLGILPGIVRGLVLRWARCEDLLASVQPFLRRSFGQAHEAFMTNSVWGIVPVSSLDGRALRMPLPGPVTWSLMRRYDRWVERETDRAVS